MPEYENVLELNVDKFYDGYWGHGKYKGRSFDANGETWTDFFASVIEGIKKNEN